MAAALVAVACVAVPLVPVFVLSFVKGGAPWRRRYWTT